MKACLNKEDIEHINFGLAQIPSSSGGGLTKDELLALLPKLRGLRTYQPDGLFLTAARQLVAIGSNITVLDLSNTKWSSQEIGDELVSRIRHLRNLKTLNLLKTPLTNIQTMRVAEQLAEGWDHTHSLYHEDQGRFVEDDAMSLQEVKLTMPYSFSNVVECFERFVAESTSWGDYLLLTMAPIMTPFLLWDDIKGYQGDTFFKTCGYLAKIVPLNRLTLGLYGSRKDPTGIEKFIRESRAKHQKQLSWRQEQLKQRIISHLTTWPQDRSTWKTGFVMSTLHIFF